MPHRTDRRVRRRVRAAVHGAVASGFGWLPHASEAYALVLRDIGSLQERIKLGQEEAAARIAGENKRNRVTRTVATALALLINPICGLIVFFEPTAASAPRLG